MDFIPSKDFPLTLISFETVKRNVDHRAVKFFSLIFSFLFIMSRHQSEKRIRMLPEIDGLSKDTVVTSWMAKYDALMKGK